MGLRRLRSGSLGGPATPGGRLGSDNVREKKHDAQRTDNEHKDHASNTHSFHLCL